MGIGMKYLLGIDFGGGASKATLIDTNGKLIATADAEYPTLYPCMGACEQSPKDWSAALSSNVSDILKKSGIDKNDILGVAIDSATHTAVLCDEDKKPLRPAIHWTDSRSRAEANYLKEKYGERIFELAYHNPDTIWTLPQLLWVKNNEPDIFNKIKHIFFEKDYIRYTLTGVFCTDYIEAEGSMLFDCRTLEWSDELCAMAGISKDVLPPIVAPTDVIGSITKDGARISGLAVGTPVICGTTDTVMEIFASGATQKGDMTLKLATAGRICVITDKPYPHKHLINYTHISKGLWYPGTATKSCAASYRWYRDTFGGEYKEMDKGAESIPIGCEGLIFHPYLNGELTPYGDPMLCADFTGVRATHTKAHFDRAVLEGVCYSLLDCYLAVEDIGMSHKASATVIGGGAKSKLWRQMVSDALGITLKTVENSDSSLGSAMLAGVALGVFKDPTEAVNTCVKVKDTVTPNLENTPKYRKVFERYKKITEALAPIYSEGNL